MKIYTELIENNFEIFLSAYFLFIYINTIMIKLKKNAFS